MPALVQLTSDHPLAVVVPQGQVVIVYNRFHSAGDVVVHPGGKNGMNEEGFRTLKADNGITIENPGLYWLTTETNADLKLIGGGYG